MYQRQLMNVVLECFSFLLSILHFYSKFYNMKCFFTIITWSYRINISYLTDGQSEPALINWQNFLAKPLYFLAKFLTLDKTFVLTSLLSYQPIIIIIKLHFLEWLLGFTTSTIKIISVFMCLFIFWKIVMLILSLITIFHLNSYKIEA